MFRMTLTAIAVLFPLAALANDGLTVRDAYARSANPQVGAAFMVIENPRQTDCLLTSASSAAAARVELHTHSEQDGVMQMHQVDSITIPARGEHALERGGDHVMMMGLTQPLSQNDVVIIDLDFGDCGTVQVEAAVDNDRTPGHGPGRGGHKGH